MADAYIQIEGNVEEFYHIISSSHSIQRANERLVLVDGEFICGRLYNLLLIPKFVEILVFGIAYKEDFILVDDCENITFAIKHELNLVDDCNEMIVKTVGETLRFGRNQKVIKVSKNGDINIYSWNNNSRMLEEVYL